MLDTGRIALYDYVQSQEECVRERGPDPMTVPLTAAEQWAFVGICMAEAGYRLRPSSDYRRARKGPLPRSYHFPG